MELVQIIVLALVQGLTEFLPVSSSAHLILVPVFSNWSDQGLAFDIAIHVGTLLAVILYFNREIIGMAQDWVQSIFIRRSTENSRLAWAILLGTIPVGIAGLTFKSFIESEMRSPLIMSAGMIGFGILLGWADWKKKGYRTIQEINWKDILIIGCAQALALFPGTSRSGITITAALMLGLNRESSARFSFLLSIPVILLAGGLEVFSLARSEFPVAWSELAIGTVAAAISAYVCIYYFMAIINRIGMMPFVIYRFVLGMLILFLFWPSVSN
ncbi:MAG: undecaprenyl-diphosphate phosphatase [Oligoflexus sp.]